MKKAFTLIELLVVVAIIGILISVAVVNYITAQKQARDAARTTYMHNIQGVFEAYYGANGQYPAAGNANTAFEEGVAPSDPKGSSNPFVWNYTITDYCICAHLETGLGNASSPGNNSSCTWTAANYLCVQNQQ